MAPQLGGSQISALLESVPGIASVLRSPVADALVNMIRAGAGVGPFNPDEASELVQYAVRRGLISGDEGDQLLVEIRPAGKGRKRAKAAGKRGGRPRAAARRSGGSKSRTPAKRAGKAVKRSRQKAAKKRR